MKLLLAMTACLLPLAHSYLLCLLSVASSFCLFKTLSLSCVLSLSNGYFLNQALYTSAKKELNFLLSCASTNAGIHDWSQSSRSVEVEHQQGILCSKVLYSKFLYMYLHEWLATFATNKYFMIISLWADHDFAPISNSGSFLSLMSDTPPVLTTPLSTPM